MIYSNVVFFWLFGSREIAGWLFPRKQTPASWNGSMEAWTCCKTLASWLLPRGKTGLGCSHWKQIMFSWNVVERVCVKQEVSWVHRYPIRGWAIGRRKNWPREQRVHGWQGLERYGGKVKRYGVDRWKGRLTNKEGCASRGEKGLSE